MSPALSVVVVPFAGPAYITRCLAALARQTQAESIDVVVPHDDTLGDVAVWRAEFPAVQFLKVDGRRTYAELRAVGVRHARAEVVALTEDHCSPDPSWCAAILEAHRSPYAAIGGTVEKGPDSRLNCAVYLCDYSRYMSPVQEGPATYLTDCNVSYKRAALQTIASLWADEFHETSVNWALQERGETLWLSPRIIVHQQRSLAIRDAVRDRYSFGRLFASTRVATSGPLKRVVYAGCSFLLPPMLVARVARTVLRKRGASADLVRTLPALLFITTIWACGEIVGYATGRPGRSLTAAPRPAARPHVGEIAST